MEHVSRHAVWSLTDVLGVKLALHEESRIDNQGKFHQACVVAGIPIKTEARVVSSLATRQHAAVIVHVRGDMGLFVLSNGSGDVQVQVLDLPKLPDKGRGLLDAAHSDTTAITKVASASVATYAKRATSTSWKRIK